MTQATAITIRLFTDADARAFHDLNEAWISENFEMEIKDREALEDPWTSILTPGGVILMADAAGEPWPVGCVAMVNRGDGSFELAKMAVTPAAQGSGIGKALIEAVIAKAQEMGASGLYLESNTKLTPAIRLYERSGFRRLSADEGAPSPYARCNIRMWLAL